MSEIEKYTVDGMEPVYELARKCDELKDVKFIMADAKLRELLICIATSVVLKKTVADAAKGFDMRKTFGESIIKAGKRYSLLLPMRKNDIIAYTVHLLRAFDVGTASLQDFLDEYFFSENGINFSFLLFVRTVILPFKEAVLSRSNEIYASASENTPVKTANNEHLNESDAAKRYARFFGDDASDVTENVEESVAEAKAAEPVEVETKPVVEYEESAETETKPVEDEEESVEEPVSIAEDKEPVSEPDAKSETVGSAAEEIPEIYESAAIAEDTETSEKADEQGEKIPEAEVDAIVAKIASVYNSAAKSGGMTASALGVLYKAASALSNCVAMRDPLKAIDELNNFTNISRSLGVSEAASENLAELYHDINEYCK